MIGGIGVTRGYLHAPELTRKSFLQNPFAEGIVYRTGDLVRRLSCGNYVFMRRLDDQVEIGGFRIQLAEIECVFQQHIFVEQAVVVVREGIPKDTGCSNPGKFRVDFHNLASEPITDALYDSSESIAGACIFADSERKTRS